MNINYCHGLIFVIFFVFLTTRQAETEVTSKISEDRFASDTIGEQYSILRFAVEIVYICRVACCIEERTVG